MVCCIIMSLRSVQFYIYCVNTIIFINPTNCIICCFQLFIRCLAKCCFTMIGTQYIQNNIYCCRCCRNLGFFFNAFKVDIFIIFPSFFTYIYAYLIFQFVFPIILIPFQIFSLNCIGIYDFNFANIPLIGVLADFLRIQFGYFKSQSVTIKLFIGNRHVIVCSNLHSLNVRRELFILNIHIKPRIFRCKLKSINSDFISYCVNSTGNL